MRFGRIALVGALVFAFSANAQDVMVNLDVLDDLDNLYDESSKPLFPVFAPKMQPEVKKEAPKQAKKSRKRKSIKRTSVKKTKALRLDAVSSNQPKSIPLDQIKPLDADAVVVDKEPVSAPVKPISEPVVAEQNSALEIAPVKSISEPVVAEQEPVGAKPVLSAENKVNVTTENLNTADDLIIEEEKPIVQSSSFIKFADGADYLNDEQKANIDKIVSGYQNGPKNKIAIYSYNLDDGVDTFKKKRISLNRAVEVRSYLLKKGYKNFSIKVVNINSVSEKINTIELKEI